MRKLYVVVSGLPGSGKSTLARHLAPLLKLPVIDKDDILESLFVTKGIGSPEWRRALSRGSDVLLQKQAVAADGAILVSLWHLSGMDATSGTPTDWLATLSGRVVNVACVCPPEIAAERFFHRARHPGHRDSTISKQEALARIQSVARLCQLKLGIDIEVDTSVEPTGLDNVVEAIHRAT